MNRKRLEAGITFENDTLYYADCEQYDFYPSDAYEEINVWWTFLNSGNIPLRAVFVLRGLKNVTIDLGGAKIVLHGRIMPFAVYDCENVTFRNFSIDYDRPFYTQGTVLSSEVGSAVIEIPQLFRHRIEGHDFIAVSDTWEHRLITGDMLFRCMNPENGRPSQHSGVILGLIGDEIFPRPNPPLPIHHLYAEDLGENRVRIFGFPEHFRPQVGEILAMTHEDRRKTGFLLERCTDTKIEHVRLLHIGAMGITANLCHNISLDDFSMYVDEECPDRIITVNADSFHCFHCTGLMKVENCRFENMLDDAINIHGNYLVCMSQPDARTILVKSRSAAIHHMEYLMPGDEIVVYRGNTQEIRCKGIVESAVYIDDSGHDMQITLKEDAALCIAEGDCLENLRMPEIEVRGCRMKCMGGFRISSKKRVLIEDCYFETAGFGVLFSGDMDYWYENTGVGDVTIRNCTFEHCGTPVETGCNFRPTESAPYYHKNIRFTDNTVCAPHGAVMTFSNVYGVEYRNNTVTGLREGQKEIIMTNCDHVTIN